MDEKYLKLFADSLEKYQKLSDAEFGRLVRVALHYVRTGEEANVSGREELLWDGMKLDIDRDIENYVKTVAVKSNAGKKGAYARWYGMADDGKRMADDGKNATAINRNGKNAQDQDQDQDQDKSTPLPPKEENAARFDEFWAAYPRKDAKQDARKAWAKIKLNDALFEKILAALDKHTQSKSWLDDGGKYIPYAASWLNGKRWEDGEESESPPTQQAKERVTY